MKKIIIIINNNNNKKNKWLWRLWSFGRNGVETDFKFYGKIQAAGGFAFHHLIKSEKRGLPLLVDRRNKDLDDLKFEIELIREGRSQITSEKMQQAQRLQRQDSSRFLQLSRTACCHWKTRSLNIGSSDWSNSWPRKSTWCSTSSGFTPKKRWIPNRSSVLYAQRVRRAAQDVRPEVPRAITLTWRGKAALDEWVVSGLDNWAFFDLSHRRSEDLQKMQDEQIKTDAKEREALQLKYGKQLDK